MNLMRTCSGARIALTSINCFIRFLSNKSCLSNDFTMEQVQIPYGSGYIAGQLWKNSEKGVSGSKEKVLPLICTHGLLDTASSFDVLIPQILVKSGMQAFAVDFPGHGQTTFSPETHFDVFMEGLVVYRKIMNYFQWDKVNLIGHSMGGMSSYLFSAIFPEFVHKLISLDAIRMSWDQGVISGYRSYLNCLFKYEDKLKELGSNPQRGLYYEDIVEKFAKQRFEATGLDIPSCQQILRRGLQPVGPESEGKFAFSYNPRVLMSYKDYGRVSEETSRIFAQNIKCPVCIILGERGWISGKFEAKEKFEDFLKYFKSLNDQVEIHIVHGDHHFFINDPTDCIPIIKRFLLDDSSTANDDSLGKAINK